MVEGVMKALGTVEDPKHYVELLQQSAPSVIHSEEQNEKFIARLEELSSHDELSPAEERLAELLTLLIENFEEKQYALKPASPIEAIRELMEANDLKQKDLVDVFGTPSVVSEVLNGKRELSKEHIRKLSRRFTSPQNCS